MNMGSVLNVGFDKIYLMQNSLNMPATEVIATYTYKIGIINGQYSYSTAIGLFNTLVNFVFLITANAIAKRVFRYEYFLGAAIMSATTTGAVAQSKNDIPWNKHVRQKKTPGDLAVDFVIVLLLVFTVVAVLYPLVVRGHRIVLRPECVAGGEVTLLPKGVTFVGYAKVFANHRIWQGYLNTIIYSVVGTAVNMAVTIPCAFALSRREFKPRRVIMFLFTVTMFISGGLIPNYLLYKALGINNTMWVFILPGAVSVYNVIVARSFFETPSERGMTRRRSTA